MEIPHRPLGSESELIQFDTLMLTGALSLNVAAHFKDEDR